jgi:hypothetical protein
MQPLMFERWTACQHNDAIRVVPRAQRRCSMETKDTSRRVTICIQTECTAYMYISKPAPAKVRNTYMHTRTRNSVPKCIFPRQKPDSQWHGRPVVHINIRILQSGQTRYRGRAPRSLVHPLSIGIDASLSRILPGRGFWIPSLRERESRNCFFAHLSQ